MMSVDPTRIELSVDPTERTMAGYTAHGNWHFSAPLMSHIVDNLWIGGCESGLVLPLEIQHVVSLYKWERYVVKHDLKSFLEVEMYDSHAGVSGAQLKELSAWTVRRLKEGPTLVHCQAGLNRSSLIAGAALVRLGMTGREAIDLIRSRRSEACLCNRTFEKTLLNFKP